MGNSTKHWDFIVIGGGSGGIAAARAAASYGARVLLFEGRRLGGTCVNLGCVPKKIMWNAAQLSEGLHLARAYGFAPAAGELAEMELDWAKFTAARDAYIARLNQIYADNLARAGVTVVAEFARFCAANAVTAAGKTYRAKHILIAVGGAPVRPDIPGAEYAITSDEFFALPARPRRALIIGAGYIAVELAGVLRGLGGAVTVLLRKDRLLRNFDADLGDRLMAHMRAGGIDLRVNTTVAALRRTADGDLGYQTADELPGGRINAGYDCVLFAVSRAPNFAGLELECAGVLLEAGGHIAVDAYQNTAAAGIYAVGDATAGSALTPVAIAAGRKLATRLFGCDPAAKMDFAGIPTVVFSHPPIGAVGLTESQARAEYGGALRIYRSEFVNLRYALSDRKPQTFMKLICAGAAEKIVGCHLIGDGVDEILQGFAVAIKMGACRADLDACVAIHPTAAEELVTLRA